MFGRHDPLSVIWLVMGIWMFCIPFIFLIATTDKVDIDFNNYFLEELNECKAEVERITPICPDVEVKNSGWVFPMFLGFVWGLIMYSWLNGLIIKWYNKRKKKK